MSLSFVNSAMPTDVLQERDTMPVLSPLSQLAVRCASNYPKVFDGEKPPERLVDIIKQVEFDMNFLTEYLEALDSNKVDPNSAQLRKSMASNLGSALYRILSVCTYLGIDANAILEMKEARQL